MKPDIITCHPRDIFYPLWIEQINRDRELFDRVIVIMTQKATERDFMRHLRDYIKTPLIIKSFIDDGKDWRNAATNEALNHSYSSYVLFLEQDFLVKKGFFEQLIKKSEGFDMVGSKDMQETNRYHPSCLMVKRETLNKTTKNFSVTPDVGDHFSKFTSEMREIGKHIDLEKLDLPNWFHIAGLTQNFRLGENYYQPKTFYTYMLCSLALPQPYEWRRLVENKIASMDIEELDTKVKSFFDEYETRSIDNVD